MAGSEGTTRRRVRWWIVPSLAALITVGVPLTTASGSAHAGGAEVRAADDDPTVEAVHQAIDRFIELWNEHKLDELVAGFYAEDALMVPPNHEPIRGRTGILEYLKGGREPFGDFDASHDLTFQTTASGNLVSHVGKYSFHSGRVRLTAHELYQRQTDGSVRCIVCPARSSTRRSSARPGAGRGPRRSPWPRCHRLCRQQGLPVPARSTKVGTLLQSGGRLVTTEMSSREFNQDTGKAKKAAEKGPVYITDRGRPAHVLLTFAAFEALVDPRRVLDRLAEPAGIEDVEFTAPRSEDRPRPADFD
jgi:ketosteroid isomerase-like protein/PHD/YefM family antitoxin component YafN of YafNO toxin-antitoxin module